MAVRVAIIFGFSHPAEAVSRLATVPAFPPSFRFGGPAAIPRYSEFNTGFSVIGGFSEEKGLGCIAKIRYVCDANDTSAPKKRQKDFQW